jgi:hypothetical protein
VLHLANCVYSNGTIEFWKIGTETRVINLSFYAAAALRIVVSAFRNASKITAVDQPNNNTPFIAVIGPSRCQRSTGVTSP